MKKIETTIELCHFAVRDFYKINQHHFMAMNALDLGDNKLEIQWFFSNYNGGDVTAIVCQISGDAIIPSMNDLIHSAWVAEAELVDLFDIKIEGHQKGFMLEKDFEGTAPLRSQK